jgi:hypothetical protein
MNMEYELTMKVDNKTLRKEYFITKRINEYERLELFKSSNLGELYELIHELDREIRIVPDAAFISELIHAEMTDEIVELVA